MTFKQLLGWLWPWSRTPGERRRVRPRRAELECLNGMDSLDDRTVRSAIWDGSPDRQLPRSETAADVTFLPGRGSGTISRALLRQLSVIAVDYLLEHEWFQLLAGYRRGSHGPRRSRPERQDAPAAADYPQSTVCITEAATFTAAVSDQVARVAPIDTTAAWSDDGRTGDP
jgi:hypothetical protein